MREISKYNYEEFFLDFMEGNLSTSELFALEDFLDLHPELKEEFEEMSLIELVEEEFVFDKSSLKELPYKTDFDHFCISKLEGDLSQEEEIGFDEFLNAEDSRKVQFATYEKVKLKSDLNVLYPNKSELKKNNRKIIPYWLLSGAGIAASLLLLISVWNSSSENEHIQMPSQKMVQTENQDLKTDQESEDQKEQIAVNDDSKKNQIEELIEKKEGIISKNHLKETSSGLILSEEKIEKEEVVRISLPIVTSSAKLELIANADIANSNISVVKKSISNSGLSKLGMSWKSSVPDKKKSNSLLYAVAKMGVNKLGEIAGKKIQLEKKYDSKTEKTRLNFNSAGLGFSTTVK